MNNKYIYYLLVFYCMHNFIETIHNKLCEWLFSIFLFIHQFIVNKFYLRMIHFINIFYGQTYCSWCVIILNQFPEIDILTSSLTVQLDIVVNLICDTSMVRLLGPIITAQCIGKQNKKIFWSSNSLFWLFLETFLKFNNVCCHKIGNKFKLNYSYP